jgi:hypothetical protein
MLWRLIECNDTILASDAGVDPDSLGDEPIAEDAASPSAASSGDGDEESPTAVASTNIGMLFSTAARRIAFNAETLQAYVSLASQLPERLLDDMVLHRLGDLVEQLLYAFPRLVSNNFGVRATICRSVLCLFFALRDKAPAFNALLQRLVFPTLVRTLWSSPGEDFLHPITGGQSDGLGPRLVAGPRALVLTSMIVAAVVVAAAIANRTAG